MSPSGAGLASATSFAFTAAQFSSSDGGALTYAWDFHDGGSATGASAFHQYQNPGTYQVTVTATNGAGRTAAASLGVVVKTVSGSWAAIIPLMSDAAIPMSLTQNGSTVTGAGSYGGNSTTITGSVSDPRKLDLVITVQPGINGLTVPYSWDIAATGQSSGDAFSTLATGASICPCAGTLVRQ